MRINPFLLKDVVLCKLNVFVTWILCQLIVFLTFPDDIGLSTGTGIHLPIVGNRQPQQGKTDQVGTSTQQLGGPGNLELGELEQLTITNDNESSYDVSECMNTIPD